MSMRALERQDRADAVLVVHQLEGLVYLGQRHAMAEHAVDVELPVHPQLHEPGHLASALDAAEGGARDATAGDQEARDDLEYLAFARDADHRGEPPGLARRLDRLPHDLHVAGGLERVLAAVAAGELAESVDHAVARQHRVGRAVVTRHRDALIGAAQPAARHRAEAHETAAEDRAGRARLDLRRVEGGSETGREPTR